MITLNRRRVIGAGGLPYDAEVEWLGANGTQWIETTFIPLLGDTIHAEFYFTATIWSTDEFTVFSAGSGTYQLTFPNVRNVGNNARGALFKYFSDTSAPLGYNPAQGNWYTLNITSLGTATIGNKTATSQPIDELDGDAFLWLYRLHGSTKPFKGRISAFYIERNGQKVIDLIPVRKGSVGYMYDKVSGKIYGNAGTGSFTYGSDIT